MTASKSNVLTRESGGKKQTRTILDNTAQTPDLRDLSESIVMLRCELPYQISTSGWRHLGIEIAVRILREMLIATNDTDYTFLSGLPAVDT